MIFKEKLWYSTYLVKSKARQTTDFSYRMSIIIIEKKEYTKHNPKRLVFWQFFTYCVLSIY